MWHGKEDAWGEQQRTIFLEISDGQLYLHDRTSKSDIKSGRAGG